MTKRSPEKKKCKWGCGKETTPGPLSMHEKSCEMNPAAPPTLKQPKGECKWGCGLVTTVGALGTHEMYGCPNRRVKKSLGREPCPHCGEPMLPGPLVVHERACAKATTTVSS